MSSGFITESEATEVRKVRQEEWEKVRNAEDPVERPEEPYELRSLFERLQEQKQKKDLEYEEAHKLKNMIKGLDDDEIQFLDLIDRTKLEAARKKEMEEETELKDYRNRVAILQEKSIEARLQADKVSVCRSKNQGNSRTSQQKLLKGVVVKKNEPKKRKISESSNGNDSSCDKPAENESDAKHAKIDESAEKSFKPAENAKIVEIDPKGGLQCVAILPGLGNYNDSSSEDNSSDSEVENNCRKIDLLGRKIEAKVVNNS